MVGFNEVSRSRMKSRPRAISMAFFRPPTNGMALSALSKVPRKSPFRRIAEPTAINAKAAPSHGVDRAKRRASRRCP